MLKNSKDTDNMFRKGFKDFNPEPPDHVWENIYNRLEEESTVKKYPLWLKAAASIAALIVPAFFLLWMLSGQQEAEYAQESGNTPLIVTPVEPEIDIEENIAYSEPREEFEILALSEPVVDIDDVQITDDTFLSSSETKTTQTDDVQALPEIKPFRIIASNEAINPKDISEITISGISKFENIETTQTVNLNTLDFKPGKMYSSSLSASLAPHYSSNYFYDPSESSLGIPYETLENNLKTYSFSIKYSVQSSGRFSFETGLTYFTVGQLVNDILSFGVQKEIMANAGNTLSEMPAQSALTSLGEVSFTNKSYYFADIVSFRISTEKGSPFNEPVLLGQSNDKISQYLSFVDVPLIARYSLLDYNNADIAIRLGVSGSILAANNVYLGEGDFGQVVGLTKGINNFSMSGIGGLSINIPVTGNVDFHFEPTVRLFITPMTENNFSGKSHPLNLFLNTGISYRF